MKNFRFNTICNITQKPPELQRFNCTCGFLSKSTATKLHQLLSKVIPESYKWNSFLLHLSWIIWFAITNIHLSSICATYPNPFSDKQNSNPAWLWAAIPARAPNTPAIMSDAKRHGRRAVRSEMQPWIKAPIAIPISTMIPEKNHKKNFKKKLCR